MKRVVFAILILLALSINAQDVPVFLKPYSPVYVHENESFNVSCIPRVVSASGSQMNFYVMSQQRLDLMNVIIRTDSATSPLEFEPVFFPDYFGRAFKIITGELVDSNFQHGTSEIVCTFSPAIGISNAAVTFGVFTNPVDSVESNAEEPQFAELIKYPSSQVNFFEEHAQGGSALMLSGNAQFTLQPKINLESIPLMMEFWASLDLRNGPFFVLRNKLTGDTLVSLQVGNFYFLHASSPNFITISEEHYIGHNSWDYFNLLVDPVGQTIDIYVNDNKFGAIELPNVIELSETEFEFLGQPGLGLQLDKLIVWEFNNTLELAFNNKHFKNYSADSSTILLYENFENSDLQEEIQAPNFLIQNHNSEIVNSEAPIFSRAPDINVVVYQNFYSIEWTGKEVDFAESYSVEKSYDGAEYTEIYFTDADKSGEQSYFYSDPKVDSKEVIYYRGKQDNHDESVVYSSRVKIGQGEKEYFSLNQNHPNPFNPATYFSIEVFEEVELEISVYNIVGKKVAVLHQGPLGEGLHTFTFDGSELPSGIYFYEAKSPFSSRVKKMILAK